MFKFGHANQLLAQYQILFAFHKANYQTTSLQTNRAHLTRRKNKRLNNFGRFIRKALHFLTLILSKILFVFVIFVVVAFS